MDKYSIIIPIHNELRLIDLLINRLRPFRNDGHEIIIIDDGSTDGSNEILKNSSIIRLITNKMNKGKGHALKRGLKAAINNTPYKVIE